MAELTFSTNKTRKESTKYIFISLISLLIWVLQISVFNRIQYFDTSPSLMLVGTIYAGLVLGPVYGVLFGILSSFLGASILYDHVFYFSYPLVGLLSGLLTKNLFSDELLFFIVLCFTITFLTEFLNGWQYSLKNPINIQNRLFMVSLYGGVVNLVISPFFYLIMNFFTKKLRIRT